MIIELRPIGFVRTRYSDEEVRRSIWGVEGHIELFPEYEEGLRGLDKFSHIIVVAYLHKVSEEQRRVLRVRPRRLARLGIDIGDVPEIGVFASDSPHRPNPVAVSILELEGIERNILYVKRLDLFDGTPVLDIKPYTPDRSLREFRIPEWLQRIEERLRSLGIERAPI